MMKSEKEYSRDTKGIGKDRGRVGGFSIKTVYSCIKFLKTKVAKHVKIRMKYDLRKILNPKITFM